MWADTLAAAERAHLLRILIWGASSMLLGTGLLAWMRLRSRQSALLSHFGIQCAAWGLVDVVIAIAMLPTVQLRDLASATRLDRFLWLNVGLDAGYVLVGITLGVAGWKLGRRMGLIGAGTGVIVQGLALVLLDLVLAAHISR